MSTNAVGNYLEAAQQLRGNKGQWAAYESKGDCVVLAGPGSGKSKTLTVKMARMLVEDVRPPRGLACLTYSNECARELRRRLESVGVVESRNVYIGTVHSFCLSNIVAPYAHLAGMNIPMPLTVVSAERESLIYESVLERLHIDTPRVEMERYRRTYMDRAQPDWMTDPQLANLVMTYEQALRDEGYIDFDDMVLLGLTLVETHAWVRRAIKARFPILVVDEYQDLGVPLHRLVLALRRFGVRIFAVGDPNQSIYGFTGANPALLRDLGNLEGMELIQLRLNYRCGKKIVEASQTALGEDRGYVAAGEHQGTIDFYECGIGPEEQAKLICEQIIPDVVSRRTGIALGEIAVLYSDRYDGDVMARSAQTSGYRFVRLDRGAPYPKTPFTRFIEDCAAWCAGGWQEGIPRLSSLIATWLMFHNNESSDLRRQELQRQLVGYLWASKGPDVLACAWLREFRERCIGNRWTIGDGPEQEAYELLANSVAPGATLSHFTVAHLGGQRGGGDVLNLVTLHSAKGLEYDVVILMGMEYGKLPRFNASTEDEAEAARLFYVGLTRARHEIHITYSNQRMSRRGNPYPTGPCSWAHDLMRQMTLR